MDKAISPYIQQNHAGQDCYVVYYDEDQWFKCDDAGHERCIATWVKKAKPLGALFVVVRLFPDPLFPSRDRTTPYIARSIPIDRETFDPVTVTVKLVADIHPDTYKSASEMERANLRVSARNALAMQAMTHKGCTYEIWTRGFNNSPTCLERGKF